MTSRSSLKSKQRGFLLNPFRYGNSGPPPSGTPPFYDDLVDWLDASDNSTITAFAGYVSQVQWKKSGKLWVQAVTTAMPMLKAADAFLKQQYLDFAYDGSTQFLMGPSIPINTPSTVVFVAYVPLTSQYRSLALFNGNSGTAISNSGGVPYWMLFRTPAIAFSMQRYDGGNLYSYTGNNTSGLFGSYFFVNPNATVPGMQFYKNTTSVAKIDGTTGSFSANASVTSLGSSDNSYVSEGKLGEVLIYNRALSAAEIADVVAYADAKWKN